MHKPAHQELAFKRSRKMARDPQADATAISEEIAAANLCSSPQSKSA